MYHFPAILSIASMLYLYTSGLITMAGVQLFRHISDFVVVKISICIIMADNAAYFSREGGIEVDGRVLMRGHGGIRR
jgi:hypothetical protein